MVSLILKLLIKYISNIILIQLYTKLYKYKNFIYTN